MGHIIPRALFTGAQITSKIKGIAQELKILAAKQTSSRAEEWVVRDALPATDFGFNKEKWENQTAFAVINTWQVDWNQELDDDTYAAFYGIELHALNPTIYGARFKLGSSGTTTIDVLQFQKLKLEEIPIGFFDRILYTKQKHIYVELIADALTAQYGEEFELLCLICEKYGEIVSGPKKVF